MFKGLWRTMQRPLVIEALNGMIEELENMKKQAHKDGDADTTETLRIMINGYKKAIKILKNT